MKLSVGRMPFSQASALVAALLLGAAQAAALDPNDRWFATIMASAVETDDDRHVQTEISGYHVGVGRGIREDWGVEFNVTGARLKNTGDEVVVEQLGLGLDLTRRLWDTEFFVPYAVLGAGYLESDDERNDQDTKGAMASFGLGVMTPVSRFFLRAEARARREFDDPGFTDYIVSIGVQIPVSYRNMGPPRADRPDEPYRWKRDLDGDDVPDVQDKCPETPAGAAVNAEGCSSSDDPDGDRVPSPQDACPDTPAGVPVDRFGCRILPEQAVDMGDPAAE